MKNQSVLTLLVAAVLFASFFDRPVVRADPDPPKYPGVHGTDASITTQLTGTWTGKEKGFRGTLEYRADGVCTSKLVPEDFPLTLFADPYSFEGTWKIDHGVLYSTVVHSSTPKIPKGKVYKNTLLELNHDSFVTKNELGWTTPFKRQE
jgi:hypothetical protein